MERIVVGKVSEIPPGSRRIVAPFDGKAGIGVFNVEGSFYAIRNICPHKNGPLCTGELCGRIGTDAPPSFRSSVIEVDGTGQVIRCPWHQWPFEIASGKSLFNDKIRVKTYPITIVDDEIVVELG